MRVIQLRSSMTGEGKTNTSANRVVVPARAAHYAALVDRDLVGCVSMRSSTRRSRPASQPCFSAPIPWMVLNRASKQARGDNRGRYAAIRPVAPQPMQHQPVGSIVGASAVATDV